MTTQTNETCGAAIGEMVAAGTRTLLSCGLAKGHPGSHVPAGASARPLPVPRPQPATKAATPAAPSKGGPSQASKAPAPEITRGAVGGKK